MADDFEPLGQIPTISHKTASNVNQFECVCVCVAIKKKVSQP
jgi:hypothetical protein